MLTIKQIATQKTFPIRLEVLRKNIDLPYKFDGDFDKDTFHLGAYKNDSLIAVSSFMKFSNAQFKGIQYQLRGMATLNKYRGIGAGKQMVDFALRQLRDLKAELMWCNARVEALGFYKKMGFQTVGNAFDVPKIGVHFIMIKEIF